MSDSPADGPDSVCAECGQEVVPDDSPGVFHHADPSSPTGIDHDLDEDHVPLVDEEGSSTPQPGVYVKDGYPDTIVEPEGTVTQGDARFAQFPTIADACTYVESLGWRRKETIDD